MRYDKPIYFQTRKKGAYNATTGNYDPDNWDEVKRYASITETGTDTLHLLYGSIKQRALTIRLQRPYAAAFDRIRIGEKFYNVDRSRLYSRVFVISEVP